VVAACVPFFDGYELVATGIAKAVGLDDDPDLRAFVVPLDRLAPDDAHAVLATVPAATWATVAP
jgi:hypothetical protein